MWDGLLMLILLCVVMAVASFLAGILPLTLSLTARQLRLITALGTGVLVGTSLIVIIPEGIETLYAAGGNGGAHAERAVALAARGTGAIDGLLPVTVYDAQQRRSVAPAAVEIGFTADPDDLDFMTGPDDGFGSTQDSEQASPKEGTAESHARDPHAWVGLSLIAGFVLMYLIDTIPQRATSPSQPQRFAISLNQFSFNRSSSVPNENAETPTQDTFSVSHSHSSRPSSTTVGLVIHGAADGIALGASSTSTSKLTFIIFLALMIHKAPAAFGLTSVLLKQGLSKRTARTHLIVFSLAAPVGALLTWSAAHLLGYSSSTLGDSTSTEFATGVLLLFSGGTFLYVAMHTMQEGGAGHEHEQANGYAGVPMGEMYEQPAPHKPEGPGLTDTLVTVGGMLLPLLTQWGHAH